MAGRISFLESTFPVGVYFLQHSSSQLHQTQKKKQVKFWFKCFSVLMTLKAEKYHEMIGNLADKEILAHM